MRGGRGPPPALCCSSGLVVKVPSWVALRRVPEAWVWGKGQPPPRPRRVRGAPPTHPYGPRRSCTPPRYAGTRSSERRCRAKGLWATGAWILRGDISTCGLWFRLVPLRLDATLVPAPSLPPLHPQLLLLFLPRAVQSCTGSPSRSHHGVAHSPSVQAPGQAVAGSPVGGPLRCGDSLNKSRGGSRNMWVLMLACPVSTLYFGLVL